MLGALSAYRAPSPSPASAQFLVEAVLHAARAAAAAAAARHRPTVLRPHLILSWQGFTAVVTSVADPPLPACPRIDPHAHVHVPSSSNVSNTAIGTLAREGVRPDTRVQGLTTAGSWATKSPQRVLKVAADRPSAPPCRPIFVAPKATSAPSARAAAAVGLKYGHNGI